jgi:hypothetical protein
MRRGQAAAAGFFVCLENFEAESHFCSLSGEDKGRPDADNKISEEYGK